MQRIKNIVICLFFTVNILNAYNLKKEGNWWYMYDNNQYIIGSYTKNYFKKYRVVCGSPSVSETKNKYYDKSYNMNMMKDTLTDVEAQNRIKKYCKKRQ